MVEQGKEAPDFELATDAGDKVRLSDLRGKQVVLYFYPKDDTSNGQDNLAPAREAPDRRYRETHVP